MVCVCQYAFRFCEYQTERGHLQYYRKKNMKIKKSCNTKHTYTNIYLYILYAQLVSVRT